MAIKLKIGSPVVGEDFFGREIELGKAEAYCAVEIIIG